ncbi:MAG: gluconate 2-dehydrogenase subunit 3 family protein [Acidobacteria bacterium]|nr:gluconate 2-dehydrogenase subunit 3 family protein [Acidobacteriota bacterium]
MTPAGRDDHGGGHLGNDVEDRQRGLSRRELLKLAASAATVPCAISVGLEVAGAAPVAPAVDAGQAAGVLRAPLQALTATEAELLDAIVARLIPTDAGGPGASEAGAVRYIDRALAGAPRRSYSSRRPIRIRSWSTSRPGRPPDPAPASKAVPRGSSRWCGPTRCRAPSATHTTAAM